MFTNHPDDGERRLVWLLLTIALGCVVLRLAGLGLYPVMDTAEARYAEIARKMVELGAWLVPMYPYTEPFWAKPPLSFWATAVGLETFGVNAFGARFPNWLFGIATMALMWRLAGGDRRVAALALVIFVSANLGYEATGAVKTDPSLMFTVTLALSGFWLGVACGRPVWYFACFVGVGAALLAKGPVGLVLCGLTGLCWLLWQRRLVAFLLDRRWLVGTLIAAAVALPWYVLAERASPGFLQYFLIGEHFERFVVPGWEGDLYGEGHRRPPGMIWAYLLEGLLPWSLLLPALLVWRRRAVSPTWGDSFERYCWCWLAAPLVLFTLSSNLLPTYVMTSLPAASLLLATWLLRLRPTSSDARIWLVAVIVTALLLPAGRFVQLLDSDAFARSRNQQPIVDAYRRYAETQPAPLVYVGRRRFSAEFYHAGQITYLDRASALGDAAAYLVVHQKWRLDTPPKRCSPLLERNEHFLFACFKDIPI